MKLKTNIKCTGCLATVRPYLDKVAGENKWQVDLRSADRILTVEGDKTVNEIIDAVKDAGFIAVKV